MANRGQYDEEARAQERIEKETRKAEKTARKNPVKNFAGGVKQSTYDSATGLIADTAEGTAEDAPVVGTLEGARKGTAKVLDNTVKGVGKVATLGYGDVEHYEVEEPEVGSGEPTKIRIKIPGT
jgi:hypothetical protein